MTRYPNNRSKWWKYVNYAKLSSITILELGSVYVLHYAKLGWESGQDRVQFLYLGKTVRIWNYTTFRPRGVYIFNWFYFIAIGHHRTEYHIYKCFLTGATRTLDTTLLLFLCDMMYAISCLMNGRAILSTNIG